VTTGRPTPPDRIAPARLRQWYQAFGIALMEIFAGAPWRVELEQELALKSQLLDVAIIEATNEDAERHHPGERPDGLENLRAHNLLTYKSRHEVLTAWVGARSRADRSLVKTATSGSLEIDNLEEASALIERGTGGVPMTVTMPMAIPMGTRRRERRLLETDEREPVVLPQGNALCRRCAF
jgi:hypothetical protein